jgi:hypothetical protein
LWVGLLGQVRDYALAIGVDDADLVPIHEAMRGGFLIPY